MSANLSVLLQSVVAWLLLLAVCALAVEVLCAWLGSHLRAVAMSGRLLPLLVLAWLPILAASLVLAGCYLPGVLAAMGWSHDHCHLHGGHNHLCLEHVYPVTAGPLSWALVGAAALWFASGLRELVSDVRRGHGLTRSLTALSDLTAFSERDEHSAIIDAELPLSVTAGLWAPRIFVTSALMRLLSPQQRRAVLEHERCHARERHALLKLAAAFGALCLRPATRRLLLQELALACERRSDEAAAAAVGDRFEVAATLLATRRALGQRPPLGVLALNGAAGFEARIRGLMDHAEDVRHGTGLAVAAVPLVAGAALFAGNELHHGIETVLSLFFS